MSKRGGQLDNLNHTAIPCQSGPGNNDNDNVTLLYQGFGTGVSVVNEVYCYSLSILLTGETYPSPGDRKV